ncbi:hypothetical protein C8R43DRAFT_1026297 [Mycena crocata]|nr:hypothetical protein C8R43DRAFT_1026297 [Mycena crocata]
MEGPHAQPQPLPRMRIPKQPLATVADYPASPEEARAGPSRPWDHTVVTPNEVAAGENDPQPTPKGQSNSNGSPHADPAARLREVLSRANSSKTPVARPASPSEVDSDFDPPRFSPTTPSVVKESLKDIFSRALRDPGDTPVKGRPQRSRDDSEVETSDRPREQAKYKGKSKSLSDEEPDKPSNSRSEASFRSSQAATFDNLRERLTNSHTPLKDQIIPATLFDNSSADNTTDTAAFLRDLNSSRATPPVATSTPPHSMEMSANSRYQTNLMDNDSEMQHMMGNLDSYEGDSGPSRPVSFPSSLRGKSTRPGSWHAQSSTSQLHRASHNGARPVSQASTNSDNPHDQPDHVHELEREWNKPHSKAPPRPGLDMHHSHGHDPRSNSPTVTLNGHARARTRSGGSAHSDGLSSRGSSFSSHSDYKERLLEHEKERNAEREHAWNRPQTARPTSSLSVHSPVERSRKLSQPLRPGSSQSMLAPSLSRHHSTSSSHSSHSHAGSDEEEEIKHEIEHERERNWGAPVQRWNQHSLTGHHSHGRSPSPLPHSPSASTSSNLRPKDRVRAESLRTGGTPKGDSPVHRNDQPRPTASSSKIVVHATPVPQPQARPKSLLGTTSRPRPMSYPARPHSPLPPRPHSPLPPIESKTKTATATSTSSTRRPLSRALSPERERGHSRMPSSPSPSPGNRPLSRSSMIPVRSPGKTQKKASATTNGHNRTPAESHRPDSPSPPPPPKILEPEGSESANEGANGDPFTETDEEHTDSTPVNTVEPPVRQRSPPSTSPPRTVPSDDALFQKALTLAPPPSPPPSPPTPPAVAPPEPEATSTVLGLLSTPPKRPSFQSSRLEFQTPSPPHGLPDLPGPPSSDEDTETEQPIATPLRFNGASDMTSTQTPRPPGAWASTPAPLARAQSLSALDHDDSDSQNESGLATPVASLSRASSFPAQTPKPPGGWIPTPRKSILKVRFNPQPELELSATEEFSSTNGHAEESLHIPATGLATPVEEEEESSRVHTPGLPAPVSPSRSPRRSPTIRVVDEYGRPDKSKPVKSPKNRNKNPVRIVDAMGREVETVEQSIKIEPSDDLPLDRNEALRAVREGVHDLVQGLNEMDISGDFILDEDRLRELDNTSRAARETRDGLKQAYHDRTAQLRASMLRSKSHSEQPVNSRSRRIWLWTFIILTQVLFIFLIYRFQKRSTRELFLTTYYDPFYPDLHLYGIKYDYISFPRTPPSVTSLSQTLRQEGFKAFCVNFVDTAIVLFADWRQDTWRRWGADDMQSVRWPPT